MRTLRSQLNEYLFHEFGHDGPEDRISDNWPFELREVGQTDGLIAFEFDEGGERFFAVDNGALTFLPVAGMTFDDLVLQTKGSRWIAVRDPVDLATSRPGDGEVPSGIERRNALQALGESYPAKESDRDSRGTVPLRGEAIPRSLHGARRRTGRCGWSGLVAGRSAVPNGFALATSLVGNRRVATAAERGGS